MAVQNRPSVFETPGSEATTDAGDLTSGQLADARLSSAVQTSLALADTAVQPGDLADVATSGAASDLTSGQLADARLSANVPLAVLAALTVQVPTDFATIQAAIDALSHRPHRQGEGIAVNIETGHALTAGITLENGDYSHFTITSTDAEVALDAGWTAGAAVAAFTNCRAPNWGILVDCGGKDTGDRAILVQDNSDLFILDGRGLKNAGGAGLANGLSALRCSRVTGSQVVLTGCGGTNLHLSHRSDAWLERANFSGGEATNGQAHGNVFVSRGSTLYAAGANFSGSVNGAGLKVRRSIAIIVPFGGANTTFDGNPTVGILAEEGSKVIGQVRGADTVAFSNCGTHGVDASGGSTLEIKGATFTTVTFDAIRASEGSSVLADDAVLSGIGRDGVVSDDSFVSVDSLSAAGVGGIALNARNGGRINAGSATCTGALGAQAVFANTGGEINCPSVDVSNAAAIGLRAQNGGRIVATTSTGTGCGTFGLSADAGGEIVAPDSDYSGATTAGGVATNGSRMTVTATNLQMGGSTSTNDCKVGSGGIAAFAGGTGGTNVTVNTVTGSGIIFR